MKAIVADIRDIIEVMGKKRRTKKQKMQRQKRRLEQPFSGFVVSEKTLKKTGSKTKTLKNDKKTNTAYLRSDLTKILLITMLAVALELALWRYFSR